ncbi:MAG TPA: flagellar basal body-associated protein FliL [Telluria sp.]|nr:flagellar basal body-associated protein FliL [Telluria sp.]
MKANPKMKADPKADAAAAPNPKKKLLGMLIGAVVVLVLGGGLAWYFTSGTKTEKVEEHKSAKHEQPEYIALEPFTVNLQPENGEQYLQVQFTLQVQGAEQAQLIKDNMAKVRSRVLLLLSGKHASEINTVEGKQQLAKEIVETLKQPFFEKGKPQDVSDVLFTAFIIQ